MSDQTLPRDEFTTARRSLADNPGAVSASSRVDIADFFGRLETWTVDTFKVERETTAFIQKMSAEGALRLVLPPQVMQALLRHSDRHTSQRRSRGAAKALETRKLNGQPIGNPAALAKARKARKRAKGGAR